jgi:transposase
MSGHSSVAEVEVIASTRRRWSEAERRSILSEAGRGGATVSEVARGHGLSPSLLFRWRREFKQARKRETAEPSFVPLALPAPAASRATTLDVVAGVGAERIEIVLAGGLRLIVGKDVDTVALRRILDVLEERHVRRSSQSEAG